MEGTDPHIKSLVMNHAPVGVTQTVYDQYDYAPQIATALNQWGGKVEKAVSAQNSKGRKKKD